VYGLVELKTHAKIALIVAASADAIRRYVPQSGPGTTTPRRAPAAIPDVGLVSADPTRADLNDLFNELFGLVARPPQAAFGRYPGLAHLPGESPGRADRSRIAARSGRPATRGFAPNLNGLTDPEIITALYRASARAASTVAPRRAGRMHASVPAWWAVGTSSVSSRPRAGFLEHRAHLRLHQRCRREYYIGSADGRVRNYGGGWRCDAGARIARPRAARRHLDAELDDPTAWDLDPTAGIIAGRSRARAGSPKRPGAAARLASAVA